MSLLDIVVLTVPRKRSTNVTYDFHAIGHVTEEQQKVLDIVIFDNEALARRIQKDDYLTVTNFQMGEMEAGERQQIKFNKNTKVFQTTEKFTVETALKEKFFNSDVVKVADVRKSPEKRRLSVVGNVSKVSSLIYADNNAWVRRDVEIEEGGQMIKLKLWNEKKNILKDSDEGAHCIVKNVEVKIFETRNQNFYRSLNSTAETEVIINDKMQVKELQVRGVDYDGEEAKVLTTCGSVLTGAKDIVPKTVRKELYRFQLRGTKIVSMTAIHEDGSGSESTA